MNIAEQKLELLKFLYHRTKGDSSTVVPDNELMHRLYVSFDRYCQIVNLLEEEGLVVSMLREVCITAKGVDTIETEPQPKSVALKKPVKSIIESVIGTTLAKLLAKLLGI